MKQLSVITFGLLLFVGAQSHSAGYTTADTSVVSMGMAGTGVARSSDPAAAFINPAALLFGKGLTLSGGAIMALPSIEADLGSEAIATEDSLSFPPNLHIGYSDETFAAGASFTVPYGSGIKWPEDWDYRFDIVSAEMRVLRTSGFVGARYGMVSVAAGPNLDIGKLGLQRSIDFISDEGKVDIDTSAVALGGHVGLFVQPLDNLSFGLTYRSASAFDFSGSANFETPDEFQSRATNGPVNTSLTMPARWAFGVQWQPIGQLELAAELEHNQWSSVDVLVIDFEDPGTEDVEKVRDWSDTTAFRFGAAYHVDDGLALRGGVFWDPSPVSGEGVGVDSPDSSRLGLSLGLGVNLNESLGVDVGYQYLGFQGAQTEGAADQISFAGQAHLMGLAFRYSGS